MVTLTLRLLFDGIINNKAKDFIVACILNNSSIAVCKRSGLDIAEALLV